MVKALELIQLTVKRIIEDPPPREWLDVREFHAGEGEWTIRFHDSYEWHMGAPGWSATLLKHGYDVSAEHRILKTLPNDRGFDLPIKYQPWCNREPILAIQSWSSTLCLYNADKRRARRISLADYPMQVEWAPCGKLLALTCGGHAKILDWKGKHVANVAHRHPPKMMDFFQSFWWPDGDHLAVIWRTNRRTKTRLSLFRAKDGRLLGSAVFDPFDLLPYDREAYPQTRWSRVTLRLQPGTRGDGSLLNQWSRIEFDPEQLLFRAFVYRPISPCELVDGEYLCFAKERAVEVAVGV